MVPHNEPIIPQVNSLSTGVNISTTISVDINQATTATSLLNHDHQWITMNDGSYNVVCAICGIKAQRSVLYFNE